MRNFMAGDFMAGNFMAGDFLTRILEGIFSKSPSKLGFVREHLFWETPDGVLFVYV